MIRILVIDDDRALANVVVQSLQLDGHAVVGIENGPAALAKLAAVDLVLTELKMVGLDGMEVLRAARKQAGGPDVVVMTASGGVEAAVAAMKAGAADVVAKPFSLGDLRRRLGQVASARQQRLGRIRLDDAPADGVPPVARLLTAGFNLDAFEDELLRTALDRTGGNKSAAARLLGITRRRLYSRLPNAGD